MKTTKIIYGTTILLVFILLVGCFSAPDKLTTQKPLFPDRHGWGLKQITIADTNNNALEFKRVDCVWVIGNENKPSYEPKVTSLADKLVSMVPAGLVTQKNDRYSDVKIGDASFSRKIVLTFKDKKSFTVLIGSPALNKPAYIRLADKKEVYWIDEPLLKQLDLNSQAWLNLEEG